MSFPGTVNGSPGFEKSVTTTQKHRLGTKMEFADGRTFFYSKAAEAITAGQVTMGTQTATDHDLDREVAAAVAVGENRVTVTNGGSTAITGSGKFTGDFATRGDYVDGYLFVNDEAGEGQIFTIKDHSSAATGATITIDLYDNDSVRTALTTSSQVGLHKPVGHSVEIWDASDIDSIVTGVPACNVASGSYFWNQVKGPAAVQSESSMVLGNEAFTAGDGRIGPSADNNSVEVRVGVVLTPAGGAGEHSLVDLQIRG